MNSIKKFLKGIDETDNVLILCHDDLDGIASGILFYDYCLTRKIRNVDIKSTSYDLVKLKKINLKKITKIIISDLGPELIYSYIDTVPQSIEVFYTDHHQKNNLKKPKRKFLELRTINQGYVPSSRTAFELCGGKYWLSVLGTLSDFGEKYSENRKFLEDFYIKEGQNEKKMIEQMIKISKAILFLEKNKDKSILDELKNIRHINQLTKFNKYEKVISREIEKNVRNIEKTLENLGNIIFYEVESTYNIKSFLITSLALKKPKKVWIFVSREKPKRINISARNHSREYNVIKILEDNIKEGSAGGHKAAAGGQIPLKELKPFKYRLSQYNIEKARIK